MAKHYSANEVTLVVNGLLIDSGFGENVFLKITHEEGRRGSKSGADGEIVTWKTNSRKGMMEITLLQTSEGNTRLAALAEVDQKLSNGAGIGPFMVKDRTGTTLMTGQCWIEKLPDPEFGKEATERVWTLGLDIETDFPGGA